MVCSDDAAAAADDDDGSDNYDESHRSPYNLHSFPVMFTGPAVVECYQAIFVLEYSMISNLRGTQIVVISN